jgi:hypothetical protein
MTGISKQQFVDMAVMGMNDGEDFWKSSTKEAYEDLAGILYEANMAHGDVSETLQKIYSATAEEFGG